MGTHVRHVENIGGKARYECNKIIVRKEVEGQDDILYNSERALSPLSHLMISRRSVKIRVHKIISIYCY